MVVVEFEWDDANMKHVAERGLEVDDVDAMLNSRITTIRNRNVSSGDYKFIGRGRGGQLLTIIVRRTAVPGQWRPVTGRRATDAEKRRYER